MVVEFKNNNCFSGLKEILIRDDRKLLKIFYGATEDLYFDIFGCRDIDENGQYTATFSINKNEEIYQYFESLINNITDCKVFDVSDIELELCEYDDEIKNEIDSNQSMNEKLKTRQTYKQLVQNGAIIWYSDNIYDEKANKMKIEKNDSEITFTFVDNPDDPTFGFGIRICNSDSKYDPFNLCFMNLFNQLQTLNKGDVQKN